MNSDSDVRLPRPPRFAQTDLEDMVVGVYDVESHKFRDGILQTLENINVRIDRNEQKLAFGAFLDRWCLRLIFMGMIFHFFGIDNAGLLIRAIGAPLPH